MSTEERQQLLLEAQCYVGMLKDMANYHGAIEVREQVEKLAMSTLKKLEGGMQKALESNEDPT